MTLTSTPDNPAPPGAINGLILAAGGVRLRTARWAPSSPIGTIVLLGGRSEFIEKYIEVVGELLTRRFAVAAVDWRDQWIGLSHSIGAAVRLGALSAGRCPFESLALTSPMIAVKGVNHRGGVRPLMAAFNSLGMGGALAPESGGENRWLASYNGSAFTSDEGTFARGAKLVAACPDLRLGGPTTGWTHAALRHLSRLGNSRFLRTTLTPTLIVAAAADRVTDTSATMRLASRLGAVPVGVIAGARGMKFR
jgi:lysophospholipase